MIQLIILCCSNSIIWICGEYAIQLKVHSKVLSKEARRWHVMWNGKKPFNDISATHNGKYMPIMDWAKFFLILSLNVIDNNKT